MANAASRARARRNNADVRPKERVILSAAIPEGHPDPVMVERANNALATLPGASKLPGGMVRLISPNPLADARSVYYRLNNVAAQKDGQGRIKHPEFAAISSKNSTRLVGAPGSNDIQIVITYPGDTDGYGERLSVPSMTHTAVFK